MPPRFAKLKSRRFSASRIRNCAPPLSGWFRTMLTGRRGSALYERSSSRSKCGPAELDAVREALLAFSGDSGVQNLIAKTLGEDNLNDKQKLFLLDTIDASKLKALPASWNPSLAKLLDSPHANLRVRTIELIRSRAVPGFDQQIEKITNDSSASDQLRATALEFAVARDPQLTDDQFTFLTQRLSSQTDAVLRQTVARIIGRSKRAKSNCCYSRAIIFRKPTL